MPGMTFGGKGLKILDFDIECRPLSWYGGDWVTREITAIAAKFIGGKGEPRVWLLGEETPEEMLRQFVIWYNQADMVTGHFIRGYDLPTVSMALAELRMPPLGDKLSHDTKLDLIKGQGLSKSQENLAASLGVKAVKIRMNQGMWREANRLTPDGIQLTRERVIGDVIQHIALRARLLELGMLKPPRVWRSG